MRSKHHRHGQQRVHLASGNALGVPKRKAKGKVGPEEKARRTAAAKRAVAPTSAAHCAPGWAASWLASMPARRRPVDTASACRR